MAGAVDRIGYAERVAIIIVGPTRRIIVEADGASARRDDVDMMRQREILKTELIRHRRRGGDKIVRVCDGLDDAHELRRHTVHAHKTALRSPAVSQATACPAIALSLYFGSSTGVSRQCATTHVIKMSYHNRFLRNSAVQHGSGPPERILPTPPLLVLDRRSTSGTERGG